MPFVDGSYPKIWPCGCTMYQFEEGNLAFRSCGQSNCSVSMEIHEQQENGDIEVAWLNK